MADKAPKPAPEAPAPAPEAVPAAPKPRVTADDERGGLSLLERNAKKTR